MPEDDQLDRLKAEQDRAFQRKQDAWEAQDRAWQRRKAARDTLDRAYENKQSAYEEQQDAWEDLQRVRDRNGSGIEQLNRQQESAFQDMKDSFDRASAAHDARDGASARMYADDGHRYKAAAQEAVAERRQLVQEIRDAKARREATRPAFQQAKAEFDGAKAEHNHARSEHERAQAEFKRAKPEFDQAKRAFEDRLAAVRSERQQRKDDKHALARRAGVPFQYHDDLYISTDADGNVNIYFGGFGGPEGPGHGHYVMDCDYNVTYARDPSDDHGAHNFADYEERVPVPGPERWEKYSSSRSHETGKPQTDIYFGEKREKGGHIAVNEDGDIEHVRDDDSEVLYNRYDPDNPYS